MCFSSHCERIERPGMRCKTLVSGFFVFRHCCLENFPLLAVVLMLNFI
nr:MAG TPA: hypothetical protein [Caudoviricetes sp.]